MWARVRKNSKKTFCTRKTKPVGKVDPGKREQKLGKKKAKDEVETLETRPQ